MLKKALATFTALFMLVGSANFCNLSANATTNLAKANAATTVSQYSAGPFDANIANEDKVIEMLKKSGKISANATYEEAQSIYQKFMQNGAKANQTTKLSKMERNLKATLNQRVQKYAFGQKTTDNNPKKVNVMVLLVDFQDYKAGNIQPDETDNYYKAFDKAHYEQLLFSNNGLKGPNGENLISAKQYYAQQSGGSLDFNGKVFGWYTLPKDAAYYGAPVGSENDIRPRNAIAHALQLAAKDPSVNFADFDKEDIYDLDSDGNFNEPDGMIDYLMVIHAGLGEDEGGGQLGENAIWSHRWNLGGIYDIPGTNYSAYDYTIEAENAAAGVCCHEFGHNLGLPDEYDTQYSSASGEPISFWSIMAGGSWGGKIAGTEPTGFSPYAKQFFQGAYGGNWQKMVTVDYATMTNAGARVTLKQADEDGQALRINLPAKQHVIVKPASGTYTYWGGKGTDGTALKTAMTTKADLTGKTNAVLNFKTTYDIENGWDYASIQAREVGTTDWTYLPGNLTTTEGDPRRDVIIPCGITGTSDWVNATFDLSAFAGKNIELKFEYETDAYSFGAGFYVDDITVTADNNAILSDNADGNPAFTLNGFTKNNGIIEAPHYYLVELRNHHGVDTGLAHTAAAGGGVISFDPGMVVWYVDEFYSDNWGGYHPGEGYLSVIDADQTNQLWKFENGTVPSSIASQRYQMHDAAFSKDKSSAINIKYTFDPRGIRTLVDSNTTANPKFDDGSNYTNPQIPTLGTKLVNYGLSIQITQQAKDNSSMSLLIKK